MIFNFLRHAGNAIVIKAIIPDKKAPMNKGIKVSLDQLFIIIINNKYVRLKHK